MPKIIDGFTFFNENDLLELRLRELDSVVDKFILVQANTTFRGKEKPDYLDRDRFSPWLDSKQLIDVTFTIPHEITDPWKREEYQRGLIGVMAALYAGEEDILIVSDADEILRREVVATLNVRGPVGFTLRKYNYSIDLQSEEGNAAVRAVRMDHFPLASTTHELRKQEPRHYIRDAGWEFSSLAEPEGIEMKFRSFAHSEFDEVINANIFRHRMEQGIDLLGRDINHEHVEIDETWPHAILEDRDYWSKYEWKSGS